jgi:hypothetical protein
VAHRNFLSILDISTDVWHHEQYSDLVRYMGLTLRTNKKDDNKSKHARFRYTDKYKVAIVVGSSEVHFLGIDKLGEIP